MPTIWPGGKPLQGIVMKRLLTEIYKPIIMLSAGEMDTGSAEVQPARDSRARAMNWHRDGGSTSAVPLSEAQFRVFLCL